MKFGTDGVRGVANTELTAAFALRLGRAAARVLRSGTGRSATQVFVGGDTRESTPMLDAALSAGFASEGLDVIRLGVVPTPMVAFEAHRHGGLGAMVSASHNPFSDNGIKLFGVGGVKLTDEVEQAVEAELHGADQVGQVGQVGTTARVGSIVPVADHAAYAAHLLSVSEGRSLGGLRVVIDAANGAASAIAPGVLRSAGAEITVVAAEPDGRNINDRCGATAPEFVAAAVVEAGADVGIALDGDADRLIAVDHTGAVVDGDHIIAITAGDLRSRGLLRNDTVVVTVMTNLGFHLAMRDAGIDVIQTGVGDRYVLEALAAGNLSLGGEQSGHVIFADHATTGDGLLTALALLDAVVRSGGRLADLATGAMTSLPQVLVNVRIGERVADPADQLAADIDRAEQRLGGAGRVLVRASGTEPLIRVMVEASTADQAQAAADEVAAAAHARFG